MNAYMLSYNHKIVIDTNVIVSAMRGDNPDSPARAVLRLALEEKIKPMMSDALMYEYEDLANRDHLYAYSPLNVDQRNEFLDTLFSVCEWSHVHYLWRPNLKDEGDNYLVELAVAGQAQYIITENLKDLNSGELNFDTVKAMHPIAYLHHWRENEQKEA